MWSIGLKQLCLLSQGRESRFSRISSYARACCHFYIMLQRGRHPTGFLIQTAVPFRNVDWVLLLPCRTEVAPVLWMFYSFLCRSFRWWHLIFGQLDWSVASTVIYIRHDVARKIWQLPPRQLIDNCPEWQRYDPCFKRIFHGLFWALAWFAHAGLCCLLLEQTNCTSDNGAEI